MKLQLTISWFNVSGKKTTINCGTIDVKVESLGDIASIEQALNNADSSRRYHFIEVE